MKQNQPQAVGAFMPALRGGPNQSAMSRLKQFLNSPPSAHIARLAGWVLAVSALLIFGLPAKAATLTYNFNDGLQGWTQIGTTPKNPWNSSGNAWNATTAGCIYGYDSDDGTHPTYWVRSPQFRLDGSGSLKVRLWGGKANAAVVANVSAVPANALNGAGFKGVALRDVETGNYVKSLTQPGTGANADYSLTAADLAAFANNGKNYTLDFLDYDYGGWGWIGLDNVSIPGYLLQVNLALGTSAIKLGESTTLTVTIPAGFNTTTPLTVYVTNGAPTLVSINGSATVVTPVVFAAGGALSQNLTVAGFNLGQVTLSAGCSALASSSTRAVVIKAVSPTGLIGRWLTGMEDLLDKSGFTPAGTHDGQLSGGLTPAFSPDVPPGVTSGSSLDLYTSGGAVLIKNTVITDSGYAATFDEGTARQISVVLWAKGYPGTWNPLISKYGEGSTGWQLRRRGGDNVATFTLRNTPGEDDPYTGTTAIDDGAWHHFAATWDGVTGERRLYVDGKLNNLVPNDAGTMGLANVNYLTLGGRCDGGSSNPGNLFTGQLFDVQIYGVALTGSEVQSLFTGNTGAIVTYADTQVIDMGRTGVVSVAIPPQANATTPITVFVTNTTPAIATLQGAVGNVLAVTFAAGAAPSKTLSLVGVAQGAARLDCACAGLTPASLNVKVYAPSLIGHWFNGSEDYTDSSGFSAAGAHDGMEVGTYGGLTFTSDTPPSKPGKAAQFAGGSALLIPNTSVSDAGYDQNFDDAMARQFSIALWVKGVPGTWNPYISKRGEDNMGWQVRAADAQSVFTIRGTPGNDDPRGSLLAATRWQHIAAVWDGYSGTRKFYIDGVLDTNINLTGDFGPFMLAANHHMIIGAREQWQPTGTQNVEGWFNGAMYDVRVYNYALSPTEVKALAYVAAIKVSPTLGSLAAPQTMEVKIVLPEGATQTQGVTVQVTNETPSIASLSGAVGNIVTLTYPVGSSTTQSVTVAGIADGTAKITATGGGFSAGSGTFNVWAQPGSRLIGHWFSGDTSFADTAGFRPAGTHDGVPVAGGGGDPSWVSFSGDVPPGYSGASLDLSAGSVAVMITNTATTDPGYVETFDYQISNKFSITFWAKGGAPSTEDWNAWVSKRGEDNVGYQVRRTGTDNPVRPTFTIRGTGGDDDPWTSATIDASVWHHYAATWDGTTGVRKLYIDGNTYVGVANDFGPFGVPSLNHFMIGGLDTGSFRRFYPSLMFDVRVYSYALNSAEVGVLVNPPANFTITLAPPAILQGQSAQLVITLPANATATSPVTVFLTNNSPSVVSASSTAITFPIGAIVQSVTLQAIGLGQVHITAGATGLGSAALATVNMVVAPKLIGHWIAGADDLADKSGFSPAGTHDGVVVGANPESLAFSTDIPAGFAGKSLDLSGNATGSVGVIVSNSATADGGYLPTFDGGVWGAFSVAFWAKGFPGNWSGWVSKRGEDGVGWQVRRMSGDPIAGFTMRGVNDEDGWGSSINVNDSNWHHYVGVWDGYTGTRKLYVDSALSHTISGNFAPFNQAPNYHIGIGTREANTAGTFEGWFTGKLCDVRMYNYPITAAQIVEIYNGVTPPTLKIQRTGINEVRISWPVAYSGFALWQSTKATGGWELSGLIVTVEGGENVAYAPATSSEQFFRLKK